MQFAVSRRIRTKEPDDGVHRICWKATFRGCLIVGAITLAYLPELAWPFRFAIFFGTMFVAEMLRELARLRARPIVGSTASEVLTAKLSRRGGRPWNQGYPSRPAIEQTQQSKVALAAARGPACSRSPSR
jgi:hypothetical protein